MNKVIETAAIFSFFCAPTVAMAQDVQAQLEAGKAKCQESGAQSAAICSNIPVNSPRAASCTRSAQGRLEACLAQMDALYKRYQERMAKRGQ